MRQLHFVERDAATGHVVLATSDGLEHFGLAISGALREVVRSPSVPATSRPGSAAASALSPREIQMRVRAGESPQVLADERGTELDRVMRFAAPVIAERQRVAAEARRAKARRSTTEGHTVLFGEAVDARFAAHGIDKAAVRWDSYRRDNAQWIITAHWMGGQSEHSAEWVCNLPARTVAPIDDTAADLLSDRPIRLRVASPDPDVPPNLSLAPRLDPGAAAVADPGADTVAPVRAEEVFDQARFDDHAAATPEPPQQSENASPLPLHVPGNAPTTRIPKITKLGHQSTARPTVPSWDDIMLGVRRKQD